MLCTANLQIITSVKTGGNNDLHELSRKLRGVGWNVRHLIFHLQEILLS